MEPKLAALMIAGELSAPDLVVSIVAMAFGAFAAVSPRRAAEIWASERLRNMTLERKALFVRWWRIFGIFLFATGALFALRAQQDVLTTLGQVWD